MTHSFRACEMGRQGCVRFNTTKFYVQYKMNSEICSFVLQTFRLEFIKETLRLVAADLRDVPTVEEHRRRITGGGTAEEE